MTETMSGIIITITYLGICLTGMIASSMLDSGRVITRKDRILCPIIIGCLIGAIFLTPIALSVVS